MKSFYTDLHIHIGRTKTNKPVKITASKNLTLENIIGFSKNVKGIDIIGIIDCHSPEVITEIQDNINTGLATEHSEGGITYTNGVTLFLGSEIEIYDERCLGPIHVLVYFPFLKQMELFSSWLSLRVKNITLSTQRIYEDSFVIQQKVKELDGLFIPAHVFTPHKGMYGKGVRNSMTEVFNPKYVDAIELGLSSDTKMAMEVQELGSYPFLSNSDAHSLEKIAREYQIIQMNGPTFLEWKKALEEKGGRQILSNYGLDPRLGKYYLTSCEKCQNPFPVIYSSCENCGHSTFVKGVSERIQELSSENVSYTGRVRPPYIHQIPLQFIPKLGPKTLAKLREHFGTDMSIIHESTREQLLKLVPEKIVDYIEKARNGEVSIEKGGAGRYGKVK